MKKSKNAEDFSNLRSLDALRDKMYDTFEGVLSGKITASEAKKLNKEADLILRGASQELKVIRLNLKAQKPF